MWRKRISININESVMAAYQSVTVAAGTNRGISYLISNGISVKIMAKMA
jgi:hypothetical protein